MNRRGSVALIALIGILLFFVVGLFLYFKVPSFTALFNPLHDSDATNLISFLQQNNLQAAIVQQSYPPNNASTWLVKANGAKTLLYSKDLGTVVELLPVSVYQNSGFPYNDGPYEVFLEPGDQAVYDSTLKKSFSISSYISMSTSNNDTFASILAGYPYLVNSNFNFVSPNGQYFLDIPNQELDVLEMTNGQVAQKSIVSIPFPSNDFPYKDFLGWSPNGNYVAFRFGVNNGEEFAVYDLGNNQWTNTINYVGGESYNIDNALWDIGTGNLSFFIYPTSVVAYMGSVDGSIPRGTYAVDIANNNEPAQFLLPSQIRIVGFIPNSLSRGYSVTQSSLPLVQSSSNIQKSSGTIP